MNRMELPRIPNVLNLKVGISALITKVAGLDNHLLTGSEDRRQKNKHADTGSLDE
jgi:hypothetical protein